MDSDTSEAGASSSTSFFPIAERKARTSKVGSWRRARAEALAGYFFVSPLLSLSVTQRSLSGGESENKFPVMSRDFVAFLFIYLFTSFSGYRPAQRECARTGLWSHPRCHPYPIAQPVKVGHTTEVYDPWPTLFE